MKIAVTGIRGFPSVQGGVESHCENLYPRLAEKGCDITVFTRVPYVSQEMKTYKGVSFIPVKCPKKKFLEAFIHTLKCTLKARKMKPDIFHIHAIGPSFFTPLARLLGMEVVVTNHGPDYMRGKWPLPAKLFLKFSEWTGIRFANEVIVVAKNIAEDIQKKFNRKTTVITNGVEIHGLADSEQTIKNFFLNKKRYILAVGRLVPEKGFSDLIDAFNKGKYEGWKLVIVGDADHEDKYSQGLKAGVKNNNKIVLTGYLTGESLREIFSHAGLFVLPSYHEGLPIVLLEAMSYGLSCIASDIPANRNVELSEERFFKVGDVNMLADSIKCFINKPWRKEDSINQINMIKENYNWEKLADKTMEVYSRII